MIIGPLRILGWLLGFAVIAAPLSALAFFLLAVIGEPGTCESEERPISFHPLLAASFQVKWDELDATLDAGQPSSVTFDESETTSRARVWVDERGVPVSNLFICFGDGTASASGKVDIPFFPGDVDVLIRGTLDLEGELPEVVVDEIEVGRLPGPLTDLVEGFIDDLIEDQTEELDLDHDYEASFTEGEMTIAGRP